MSKKYYTPSFSLHKLVYSALKEKKEKDCINLSKYVNEILAEYLNIDITGGDNVETQ